MRKKENRKNPITPASFKPKVEELEERILPTTLTLSTNDIFRFEQNGREAFIENTGIDDIEIEYTDLADGFDDVVTLFELQNVAGGEIFDFTTNADFDGGAIFVTAASLANPAVLGLTIDGDAVEVGGGVTTDITGTAAASTTHAALGGVLLSDSPIDILGVTVDDGINLIQTLGHVANVDADADADGTGAINVIEAGGNADSAKSITGTVNATDITGILFAGDITANITLGNLSGTISADGDGGANTNGDITGNLDVTGLFDGAVLAERHITGDVTVGGDFDGSIIVGDDFTGAMGVTGVFDGGLPVTDDITGGVSADTFNGSINASEITTTAININDGGSGNITAPNGIDANLNFDADADSTGAYTGTILVANDVITGAIDFATTNGATISANNGISGNITSDGDMLNTTINADNNAGGTGNIVDVQVGAATDSTATFTGTVIAQDITTEFTAGDIDATFNILNNLTGDIKADGDAGANTDGNLAGAVNIAGDLDGTIDAEGELSAAVAITGDLDGLVNADGTLSGGVSASVINATGAITANLISGNAISINDGIANGGQIVAATDISANVDLDADSDADQGLAGTLQATAGAISGDVNVDNIAATGVLQAADGLTGTTTTTGDVTAGATIDADTNTDKTGAINNFQVGAATNSDATLAANVTASDITGTLSAGAITGNITLDPFTGTIKADGDGVIANSGEITGAITLDNANGGTITAEDGISGQISSTGDLINLTINADSDADGTGDLDDVQVGAATDSTATFTGTVNAVDITTEFSGGDIDADFTLDHLTGDIRGDGDAGVTTNGDVDGTITTTGATTDGDLDGTITGEGDVDADISIDGDIDGTIASSGGAVGGNIDAASISATGSINASSDIDGATIDIDDGIANGGTITAGNDIDADIDLDADGDGTGVLAGDIIAGNDLSGSVAASSIAGGGRILVTNNITGASIDIDDGMAAASLIQATNGNIDAAIDLDANSDDTGSAGGQIWAGSDITGGISATDVAVTGDITATNDISGGAINIDDGIAAGATIIAGTGFISANVDLDADADDDAGLVGTLQATNGAITGDVNVDEIAATGVLQAADGLTGTTTTDGNVAAGATINADSDADKIGAIGTFQVGAATNSDATLAANVIASDITGTLSAGAITGNITLDPFTGTIKADGDGVIANSGEITGAITLDNANGGTIMAEEGISGQISSTGDLINLTINADSDADGTGDLDDVQVGAATDSAATFTGTVTAQDITTEFTAGDIDATFNILNSLTGDIKADGDGGANTNGNLAGAVNIVDDLDGTIDAEGELSAAVAITDDLNGLVHADGTLSGGVSADAITATGAITANLISGNAISIDDGIANGGQIVAVNSMTANVDIDADSDADQGLAGTIDGGNTISGDVNMYQIAATGAYVANNGLLGTATVTSDVAAGATINANDDGGSVGSINNFQVGAATNSDATLAADVDAEDITGTLSAGAITGAITLVDTLSGNIIADGDGVIANSGNITGLIDVGAGITGTGVINAENTLSGGVNAVTHDGLITANTINTTDININDGGAGTVSTTGDLDSNVDMDADADGDGSGDFTGTIESTGGAINGNLNFDTTTGATIQALNNIAGTIVSAGDMLTTAIDADSNADGIGDLTDVQVGAAANSAATFTGTVQAQNVVDFSAGDIDATFTILDDFTGMIVADGDGGANTNGDLDGTVNMNNGFDAAATLTTEGDLGADVTVTGNIEALATFTVGGDIEGTVSATGDIAADITAAQLSGSIEAGGTITGDMNITAATSTSPGATFVSDGETFTMEVTDFNTGVADNGVTVDLHFTDVIVGAGGGEWSGITMTGADADNIITFTGGDVTGAFNVAGAGLNAGLRHIVLTAGDLDAVITSDSLRLITVDIGSSFANTANLGAVNHLLAFFVTDPAFDNDYGYVMADGAGGSSLLRTLTVTNIGVGDGDIDAAAMGTGDFTITNGVPTTVASEGGTYDFDITFDPLVGTAGTVNDNATFTVDEDLDGVTLGGATANLVQAVVGDALTPMPTSFTFTDANGSTVRVRHTGDGAVGMALQGGVANNADIEFIYIFNSGANSSLTIRAFGGADGQTNVDEIGADGAARNLYVKGNINNVIGVGGNLRTLSAYNVGNKAEIDINGNLTRASLRNVGTNVDVWINGNVNAFSTWSVGNGSEFTINGSARSLRASRGAWSADVDLNGGGLTNLSARTAITSDISTTHTVGNVVARNGAFNGSVIAQNVDGDLYGLRNLRASGGDMNAVALINGNVQNISTNARRGVGGDMTGVYLGDTFRSFRATGAMNGLDVTADNMFSVRAGAINNSEFEINTTANNIFATTVTDSTFWGGRFNRFTASGNVTDTNLLAGYHEPTDTAVPGSIGVVTIRGNAHNVNIVSQVSSGEGAGNPIVYGDGNDVALGNPALGTINRINVRGNVTDGGDTFGFLADNGTFRVTAANAVGGARGTIIANGVAQSIGNVMVDVM